MCELQHDPSCGNSLGFIHNNIPRDVILTFLKSEVSVDHIPQMGGVCESVLAGCVCVCV